MNNLSRVGSLCAAFALTACAGASQAQNGDPLPGPWTYTWIGDLVGGGVNAGPNDWDYGGLFAGSTLTNTGTGQVVAVDSYCNDLGENIYQPQPPINATVYQFSNLTAAEINGTTLGSLNGNGAFLDAGSAVIWHQGGVADAGGAEVSVSGQAKVDALEYLVAMNWNTGETSPGGSRALELAIWHMWGFDNPDQSVGSFNSDMTSYDNNTEARDMVQAALDYGQSYSNSRVLWVYNRPIQNQIMYAPEGMFAPEGNALALLLMGLIPVGFAIRGKFRKG